MGEQLPLDDSLESPAGLLHYLRHAIYGGDLAPATEHAVLRWLDEFEFTEEVVLRLVEQCHQRGLHANVLYMDAVAQEWHRFGVRSIEGLEVYNLAYRERRLLLEQFQQQTSEILDKKVEALVKQLIGPTPTAAPLFEAALADLQGRTGQLQERLQQLDQAVLALHQSAVIATADIGKVDLKAVNDETVREFSDLDLTLYPEGQRNGARAFVTEVRRLAARMAEGTAECGLVLIGTVGAGKTTLAQCIATASRVRGRSVLFITEFRFAELSQAFRMGRHSILDPVVGSDLLIIDDLGTSKVTDTLVSCLIHILAERQRLRLPIVVTTMLRGHQIEELYGPLFASRLMFENDVMLLPEVDLRRLILQRKRTLEVEKAKK